MSHLQPRVDSYLWGGVTPTPAAAGDLHRRHRLRKATGLTGADTQAQMELWRVQREVGPGQGLFRRGDPPPFQAKTQFSSQFRIHSARIS